MRLNSVQISFQLASITNIELNNGLDYLYKKYIPVLMDFIFEGVVPAGGFGGGGGRKQRASTGSRKSHPR